ncbi:hypothetical protein D3C76_1385680 [compost metagenome]
MGACGVEDGQYRALLISGEQVGFLHAVLALLLRQQLVFVLEDRALYRALNLGGQAVFAVEALGAGLCRWGAIGQAIQWVVAIVA